jgi:hypothetical protein
MPDLLAPGAVFATASVMPDTTIEIQQPGYALIATADVVSAKRVKPGDHLDAKTTQSVQFDDGTGMLVSIAEKVGVPLTATVGLFSLLSHDQPYPLPINNGSTTMYVGSDRPFSTPALAIDNVNKPPGTTSAVFLNSEGKKVGKLSTFTGLKAQDTSNIMVRTLDDKSATLEQGGIEGGLLNGTPMATFDKPSYNAGEKGRLLFANQESYQKLVEMTKFGGAANLRSEPIRIIPLSDVKGLPTETAFRTTALSFTAVHAGEARVAVYFPRAAPPRPASNPGDNEVVKQANAAFAAWLNSLSK